ncbi:MAG: hybrid sensor histidine kinase/response regulator [Deltaproteobacteria bacterium]|nr:MAG: hybrid sensor histidine kinase/response regulator [Deltaproteobacteria bacterium]
MNDGASRNEPMAGVLLVDDEDRVLSALKRTLARHPFRVFTATCGKDGIEVLEREKIDVVISDYMMPEMDGVEFLTRVKNGWPDVQRVMLTGHADRNAVERAVNESEIFRFLNKPWNNAQLVATIRECVEHKRLIESNRKYEVELSERNRQLEQLNKELERKVEERTRALVHSEKMAALGRMAGGVAHEINNPLGGILAFAQLLMRDGNLDGDEQTKEAITTIQQCALRCKEIVERMLSFSRRDTGKGMSLLDMNEVARSGVDVARLDQRAKNVHVEFEPWSEPLHIVGLRTALEQVVVNLVQNALKFSPTGSKVLIRCRPGDSTAMVDVLDEGPGMAEDVLPQVFEPFFTTAEPGAGTGLGLFVSYGIARDHGGNIVAANRPEGGACFSLVLPLAGKGEEQQ